MIATGEEWSGPTFSVHMDVELTPDESTRLASALGADAPDLPAARSLVEAAMARVVPPNDPLGDRGRAIIAAAFS